MYQVGPKVSTVGWRGLWSAGTGARQLFGRDFIARRSIWRPAENATTRSLRLDNHG